jgi:hypothetical protein
VRRRVVVSEKIVRILLAAGGANQIQAMRFSGALLDPNKKSASNEIRYRKEKEVGASSPIPMPSQAAILSKKWFALMAASGCSIV